MTIAQLIVSVGADVSGIQQDIQKAQGSLDGFSKTVANAFSVAAITAFATKVMNFADHMQDLSEQTGIGVEELQAFNFVAEGAGTTIDVLASAITKLSARLANDDKSAVRGMERLGIDTQKFLEMNPADRMFAIAEAASKMGDENERNAALMDLFGKQFQQTIPVFTQDLREATEQAKTFGAVIKEDMIAQIAGMKDTLAQGSLVLQAFGVYAVKAMQAGTSGVFEQSKAIEDLNKKNQEFVDTYVKKHEKELRPAQQMTAEEEAKIVAAIDASIEARKREMKVAEESAKAAKREHEIRIILALGIMKQAQERVATAQRMADEINRIERDISENYLGELQRRNEATQAALDAQEAAWRDYQNEIGLILMEQDRLAMEHAARQAITWGDLFNGLAGIMEMVFGPRARQAIDTFTDTWRAAQGGWKSIIKLMMTDFTGFIGGIMAGIEMVRMAWNFLKGLFGGGEEGTIVNPARDKFLSQWGDPSNKGVGGAGWNLAALLTELGAGEGGGALFNAVQRADKMALFRPAAQAVIDFLHSKGRTEFSMNFHAGGMVPGVGEVNARLLGGERIQSRQEVGDMRDMVTEMRGLRADILRALDAGHSQAVATAHILRGRGNAFA
jgi:hypothetical protein